MKFWTFMDRNLILIIMLAVVLACCGVPKCSVGISGGGPYIRTGAQ